MDSSARLINITCRKHGSCPCDILMLYDYTGAQDHYDRLPNSESLDRAMESLRLCIPWKARHAARLSNPVCTAHTNRRLLKRICHSGLSFFQILRQPYPSTTTSSPPPPPHQFCTPDWISTTSTRPQITSAMMRLIVLNAGRSIANTYGPAVSGIAIHSMGKTPMQGVFLGIASNLRSKPKRCTGPGFDSVQVRCGASRPDSPIPAQKAESRCSNAAAQKDGASAVLLPHSNAARPLPRFPGVQGM